MAGLYIPNERRPMSCVYCICYNYNDDYCQVTQGEPLSPDEMKSKCPLVEIPAHGRLIDADALMQKIQENHYLLENPYGISVDYGMFTVGIQQAVDETPTIIPAEEKEE